jgi:hypothetical protein
MPTTVYDSSLVTKRRRDKEVASGIASRMESPTNPKAGFEPLLGIREQSIFNQIKTGNIAFYRKTMGGNVIVDPGCPCESSSSIPEPTPEPLEPESYWATSVNGTQDETVLMSNQVTVDSFGNVYVSFASNSSSITINNFNDVSGGVINASPYGILTTVGDYDTVIIKYNKAGQVQWVTSITGVNYDAARGAISVDSSGNVYVTGLFFSNPITINSANGVSGGNINVSAFGTLAKNIDFSDSYIAKYNTNGIAQWATSIEGSFSDIVTGIAVDSSGNIYVSGWYVSNPVTINSFTSIISGVINVTSFGTLANVADRDYYIAKYNTNGIAQWVTRIGGNGLDESWRVATDSSGNVYLTGNIDPPSVSINSYNNVSGGSINVSSFATLTTVGSWDGIVVKFNTNGIVQWATSMGAVGASTSGTDIVVDSSNNIYLTGCYNNTIMINSYGGISGGAIVNVAFGTLSSLGNSDTFVIKYDSSGNVIWATSLGGSTVDKYATIGVDGLNNIYIGCPYTSDPITIYSYGGVSGGAITLNTFGTLAKTTGTAVSIVKYNSSGTVQWVTNIDGDSNNASGKITADISGNVYITSSYSANPVTINMVGGVSGGVISVVPYGTLSNAGGFDMVIAKYNTNGQIP